MSRNFWRRFWLGWLICVAVTWAIPEVGSFVLAYLAGVHVVEDWTLSDTIRRWSDSYRWLAPVSIGTAAMLIWHFFAQRNRE